MTQKIICDKRNLGFSRLTLMFLICIQSFGFLTSFSVRTYSKSTQSIKLPLDHISFSSILSRQHTERYGNHHSNRSNKNNVDPSGLSYVRCRSQLLLSPSYAADIVAVGSTVVENSAISSNNELWLFFWQAVISNGIPALFTIFVIGFAALQLRPRRENDGSSRSKMKMFLLNQDDNDLSSTNPNALLYDDLYGNQDQDPFKKKKNNVFSSLFSNEMDKRQKSKMLPLNTGIPAQQFIKVTHLNSKFDSYQFSIQSATQSKAMAASTYKQSAFRRALVKGSLSGVNGIPVDVLTQLQDLEQKYLAIASELTSQIQQYQTQLAEIALSDEMEEQRKQRSSAGKNTPTMDTSKHSDANTSLKTSLVSGNVTAANSSSVVVITTSASPTKAFLFNSLGKVQKQLQEVNLDFIQAFIQLMGPERAESIQAALLGSPSTISSLLTTTERPLSQLLSLGSKHSDQQLSNNKKRDNRKAYVMTFPGDVSASQVSDLRQIITSIVVARQNDETDHTDDDDKDVAIVVLQSGGGTVTGYGLAAAQLMRLKDSANLKLIVCVEQVAASGGYMMACVADKIIASPFAVLGSIGVISDIPNVYERLKKEGIEFSTVTAGKYKRTLTPTKKVTKEDLEKTKADIEDIYKLFRGFVKQNRPQLDMDVVATGETWFGTDALERKLCDEIKTFDDVVNEHIVDGYDVYQVDYKPPLEDTRFGQLFGSENSLATSIPSSLLEKPLRWLVRSAISVVQDEMMSLTNEYNNVNNGNDIPVERKYLSIDDSADRIR